MQSLIPPTMVTNKIPRPESKNVPRKSKKGKKRGSNLPLTAYLPPPYSHASTFNKSHEKTNQKHYPFTNAEVRCAVWRIKLWKK